jgi:hypothetical protein
MPGVPNPTTGAQNPPINPPANNNATPPKPTMFQKFMAEVIYYGPKYAQIALIVAGALLGGALLTGVAFAAAANPVGAVVVITFIGLALGFGLALAVVLVIPSGP